tara:strand:- start:3813 stop:4010 length:198 start_codon:yes stop_codon:yes gene_type:complete
MATFQLLENGTFLTGEPVFQIVSVDDEGSSAILDMGMLTEAEAKAKLQVLQPVVKKKVAKKEVKK